MMTKEYHIQNINDLYNAFRETENKSDLIECLKQYLESTESLEEHIKVIHPDLDLEGFIRCPFVWVDDGERTLKSVKICTPDNSRGFVYPLS